MYTIIIIISLVKSITLLICVALRVGFYTLLERKTIAYIQIRKGPNKVIYLGLPQPLIDAIKLFTKEIHPIKKSNKIIYILAPIIGITITFILWSLYTSTHSISPIKLRILLFITISRLNVYILLLSGWASNSKYALLGAIRAIAQTISYEVTFALVIISVVLSTITFSIIEIIQPQILMWNIALIPIITTLWITSALAETNRAPFDLAEGESELVSGFNIEYGRGEFSFLSIAEYGRILLIRILTSTIFLKRSFENNIITSTNIIKILIIRYIFLWIRRSYPRIRYDTLIELTWKTFIVIAIPHILIIIYFLFCLISIRICTVTFQVKRLSIIKIRQ